MHLLSFTGISEGRLFPLMVTSLPLSPSLSPPLSLSSSLPLPLSLPLSLNLSLSPPSSPSVHPLVRSCGALGGPPQAHQPPVRGDWRPLPQHHLAEERAPGGRDSGPPEGDSPHLPLTNTPLDQLDSFRGDLNL